jgi:prevent-host-death family protein
MASITVLTSWDLRERTAEILRQVADGTRFTVTVSGTPVAEIGPVRATRAQSFSQADVVELVTRRQADHGLAREGARP